MEPIFDRESFMRTVTGSSRATESDIDKSRARFDRAVEQMRARLAELLEAGTDFRLRLELSGNRGSLNNGELLLVTKMT